MCHRSRRSRSQSCGSCSPYTRPPLAEQDVAWTLKLLPNSDVLIAFTWTVSKPRCCGIWGLASIVLSCVVDTRCSLQLGPLTPCGAPGSTGSGPQRPQGSHQSARVHLDSGSVRDSSTTRPRSVKMSEYVLSAFAQRLVKRAQTNQDPPLGTQESARHSATGEAPCEPGRRALAQHVLATSNCEQLVSQVVALAKFKKATCFRVGARGSSGQSAISCRWMIDRCFVFWEAAALSLPT